MFLIVGLGNYGRNYEHTRHNAGFDVLEILSRRWGVPMDRHGRKSLYGEGSALGARVILAQPQTYMNLSGDAVVALAQWYHLPPQNVIIVFDDVDLPIGRIRMRSGGSAGTHNGMRDIQLKWGKEDFPRVRVGIGRPLPGRDIKDHVLTRVSAEELPAYQESLDRAADAVSAIIEKGMIWAQDHFNGSPKPEKPKRERREPKAGGGTAPAQKGGGTGAMPTRTDAGMGTLPLKSEAGSGAPIARTDAGMDSASLKAEAGAGSIPPKTVADRDTSYSQTEAGTNAPTDRSDPSRYFVGVPSGPPPGEGMHAPSLTPMGAPTLTLPGEETPVSPPPTPPPITPPPPAPSIPSTTEHAKGADEHHG